MVLSLIHIYGAGFRIILRSDDDIRENGAQHTGQAFRHRAVDHDHSAEGGLRIRFKSLLPCVCLLYTSDPVPHLAARFAAKEAVAKALGTGIGAKCAFTDVEVVRGDAGVPSILLHGAAGVTARELGITGWFLTMTHSRLSAAATVIALAQ